MPAAFGRGASAVLPIPVTTIVVAVPAAVPTVVTVTVPIFTIVAIVSTAVIVTTTTGTAMSHVFTRSCRMRTVGNRVVNANAATIQFNSVELLNTFCSFFDGAHLDETKATRTVRTLVINDGDFINMTKPAKLIFQITFLGPNA
jgi:hypothetical protein